jgi:GTPase
MTDTIPTVALVGRPNVGKSRLFNRLARRRMAIVHDQAGVTRDVNSVEAPEGYILLDTGGIGLVTDMDGQQLIAAAEEQVWFAIQTASVICLVVDGREGLSPLDQTIAEKLRPSGKPVLVVVNKIDQSDLENEVFEFERLGFGHPVGISAEHGRNEDELRQRILELTGPISDSSEGSEPRLAITFAGRPNVGKSSLCNRLLQAERMVVSEIPGTTRDSVSINLDYTGGDGKVWPFRLVDTAGLRRKGRVSTSVEYFSTLRSQEAIEQSDIVFLVLDAETGVTHQDKTLANEIMEAGKCVAVVVNKWDNALKQFEKEPLKGYENENEFRKSYGEAILKELFLLPSSPVLFVSALTGYSTSRLLKVAIRLRETGSRKITTPKLNQIFQRLIESRSPRPIKGALFKIYYVVQTGNFPFRFRVFCNRATKLEDSYRRYLENALIKEFKLDGCPIKFELKGKTVRYANKPKK